MRVESAEAEAQTDVGVEVQEEGPEREIEGFVKGRWKVEDGWETAWSVSLPLLISLLPIPLRLPCLHGYSDPAAASCRAAPD